MKVKKLVTHVLFLLSCFILAFILYLKIYFVDIHFEQLLYTVRYMEGSSFDSLYDGLLFVIGIGIVFYLLIQIILLIIKKVNHKISKHQFMVSSFILAIFLFILSFIILNDRLQIYDYIKNQLSRSNFYMDYYINPNEAEITFPDQKRNLIYIYLESMESTVMSSLNGGGSEISYIPELENLALENFNFSHNSNLGGGLVLNNTSWTVAGMVAQTAGISLNIPINQNEYIGYTHFLPGVTSLGEILEDNGYKNYLMMGSKATFAGRNEYFMQHGNYEIFDYYTAIEEGKIDKNYYVWWGYEDKKLFTYAKEKLLEISNDEPFNFTLLTADTHFTDGYLDETCVDQPFQNQYANVFYCNSNMVYEFINWIKEQSFYENTTIILSGDHYSMQSLPIECDNCKRIYNAFINLPFDTTNVNNKNRQFTTIDMFPTTLASLNVKIKSNRLGLGTNLFSNESTLIEQLGFDYVNKEIIKKSDFYNSSFLQDSYLEMLKES